MKPTVRTSNFMVAVYQPTAMTATSYIRVPGLSYVASYVPITLVRNVRAPEIPGIPGPEYWISGEGIDHAAIATSISQFVTGNVIVVTHERSEYGRFEYRAGGEEFLIRSVENPSGVYNRSLLGLHLARKRQ